MFNCDKCGLCCKRIDIIPELSGYDRGDGVCIHLTIDNLCDIYPNRPDICNVEKMYQIRFKNFVTKDEYIKLNHDGCMELKKQFGYF